ncbi:MAG: hypothetical protein KDD68_18030, partial [Bdellovibrionales bacterium]|nr:hypothetical protein [Bdellovibrionales bacterium]
MKNNKKNEEEEGKWIGEFRVGQCLWALQSSPSSPSFYEANVRQKWSGQGDFATESWQSLDLSV